MSNNTQTSPHNESGFTFIELLVATVIFTFGILAISSLQTVAMQANSTARRMTEATTLASDRIETLMTAAWTDTTTDSTLAEGTHSTTVGGYTVAWQVTDATNDEKKKTITLGVTWQEGSKTHRVNQIAVRCMK